ncbi:hypothetical protein FH972_023219 [Carpinus fangiana]|uniref:BZIP domain-containing protein n=1 Tax=Carpinus fangiana TaxID=176857 RepID=A0A5N6KV10_9ROSI|nr:hypothetical protein FH972_023219 [Carpinus fangiana]
MSHMKDAISHLREFAVSRGRPTKWQMGNQAPSPGSMVHGGPGVSTGLSPWGKELHTPLLLADCGVPLFTCTRRPGRSTAEQSINNARPARAANPEMGSQSPPRSADDPQPWASGRVLTSQQRERKRLVDRNARRSQKQKFLERIGQLEARVLQLESGKGDSDAVAPPPKPPEGGSYGFNQTLNQSLAGAPSFVESSSPFYPGGGHDIGHPMTDPSQPNFSLQQQLVYPAPPSFDANHQHYPHDASIPDPTCIPAVQALTSELASISPLPSNLRQGGRDVTNTLNSLVYYVRNLAPESVCFDDDCNQDFLVRHVLQGWEQATSRYQQICPLWLVLRLVDLWLFKNSPVIERIAMLRMLHRMYLFEISSRSGTREPLPLWYKPQASQQLIKHDAVVDHMAWPRLRQRLTVQENNTLTNRFWSLFARNFRFAWRYDMFDALQLSRPGGLYGISGVFETSLHDISSWRMEPEFLAAFPHLADDVVPTQYMPLNRQLNPGSGQQGGVGLIAPRFGRRGDLAPISQASVSPSTATMEMPSSG